MSERKFYRKKPVVIEAWQWDGTKDNMVDIANWINSFSDESPVSAEFLLTSSRLFINTLEGTMEVLPEDYVIRGVHDEFYPCKPDIFEETYNVYETQ